MTTHPPHWQDLRETLLAQWRTHTRLGIITDMDGTISPIVPHPDQAYPTPEARRLLQAWQAHAACVAVVSGRGAADIRQRVGLPNIVYVGNHGMERWQDSPTGGSVVVTPLATPFLPALQAVKAAITARVPEGVWVEDKRVTLSVHYRAHTQPAAFRQAFLATMQALTAEYGLQLFEGRMIFEVRPPLDLHKGVSFAQLVQEYALTAALFLGDDVTDADALRVAQTLRQQGTCFALGVGVLAADGDTPQAVLSSADMLAAGVADVEALLAWLLNAS